MFHSGKLSTQFPRSFTPDGKRLLFDEVASGTGFDLWTVPIEIDGEGLRAGKPELFLQTPNDERSGAFSPDGRWLAYFSNESGAFQVYVRAFPDKDGRRWRVSTGTGGDLYPVFSRNGRELFFSHPVRGMAEHRSQTALPLPSAR